MALPIQRAPIDTTIAEVDKNGKPTGKLSIPWVQYFTSLYTATNQPANAVAPPVNSSAPGKPGQIAYDTNFIYVWDKTSGKWKRAALSTF